MRALLPATLLVSAGAIAYEILLMRLLAIIQWHHFAWMIISLALLGYGVSGTVIALARRWLEPRFEAAFAMAALLFSITLVTCFALGQRVPFNALEVVWDPQQFLHLATLYLLFMVPFFFAASCIGLAFTCRSAAIGRIYFADLLGAGLGALLLIGALFVLLPQRALLVLALLPLFASALIGWQAPSRASLLAGQGLWLAVLGSLLAAEPMALRHSPYKGLSQALQVVGSRVVAESSSPFGLLTVVESQLVPFRHAPGLSLATTQVPPEQLAVFTDGDGLSAITQFHGDFGPLGWLRDTTAALPYRLREQPRVLVLGAGAGSDVLLALAHGAVRVDAVELDPAMIGLVNERFAEYAGRLYEDDRVHVHIGEARSFAARSRDRFDLVQIGLLDSFGVSGSGVQALNESYLYTVEAIGEYLRLLEPGGILAITRWMKIPPRDSLKLTATVIAALRRGGVADPGKRLVVIRSWNTVSLLVRNGPFTSAEIEAIRDFTLGRSFDVAWYPGMPPGEANRFNQLDRPWLYEGITALLGQEGGDFMDRYKFRLEPATDNRPYFFHFFKWRVLPEVMELRERGGASLIEWGYLVLVATLVQAVLLGALLILMPLAWRVRTWPAAAGRHFGAYFFALGLAFLFIEIAFIQKFILFLGHPLYAVATVLSAFLVFAGLGSVMSGSWAERFGRTRVPPVAAAVLGIVAMGTLYLLVLPVLLAQLGNLSVPVRVGVCALLIAPLAFCMGLPFPLGLAQASRTAPDFVPWAWGVNGFASVISAALATLLAIEAGFTGVVLLALGLYGAAALLLPKPGAVEDAAERGASG